MGSSETSPQLAGHADTYNPALISRRADKMMQNRGGANRQHAEAWNYSDRRDHDDHRRGILSRAAQTVSRARLAWPRRLDLRGVLDVSRHRTGGDLFQPGGMDGVHLNRRCGGLRDHGQFTAARGTAGSTKDGGSLDSVVADF